MKKIKLIFYSPLLLLLILYPFIFAGKSKEADTTPEPNALMAVEAATASPATRPVPVAPIKSKLVALKKKSQEPLNKTTELREKKSARTTPLVVSRKEIVTYALSLMGSPYLYGGVTSNGFDCSGFISHVYNSFGIGISRSSSTQAHDGEFIAREEARSGDLVIFTGTNPNDRNPGHVGIVISEPGDTVTFVHSSSVGGVKISKVEGTGYDKRFLQIRRVL